MCNAGTPPRNGDRKKPMEDKGLLPLAERLVKKVECNFFVSSTMGWGAGLKGEQNLYSREFPKDHKAQLAVPGIKFLNLFNSSGHRGEYDFKTQAYWFPLNIPSFASIMDDNSREMDLVFTEDAIMEEEAFTFIHMPTGREIELAQALEIMANFDENGREYRFPDQKRVSPFSPQSLEVAVESAYLANGKQLA